MVATVTSIEITPPRDTINSLGATLQLTAVAYDADHNPVATTITWESLDTEQATVDAEGLVTSMHARGLARITATAGTVSKTARIYVLQVVKDGGLQPAHDTLDGLDETLTLTVAPVDSSDSPVADVTTVFTSLDTAYVSVDTDGVVTAKHHTRKNRPARIRVKTAGTDVRSRADTAFITVQQIPTNLTLAGDTINAIGDTIQLVASATDANGDPVPLGFRALRREVSVTRDGVAWSNAPGIGLIEVRSAGVVYDTIKVVSRQVAKTVEITPTLGALDAGDTLSLVAIVRDSNDVVIPKARLNWSSDNRTVATVDPNHSEPSRWTLVTAVNGGTANIRGRYREVAAVVEVTVTAVDGASHTWTGTSSTVFEAAENWNPAFAPAITDTLTIAVATNQPVLAADATIGKLIIQSSATFDLSTFNLTITDDLLVSGTLSGSGIVTLSGASGSFEGTLPSLYITGSYVVSEATALSGSLTLLEGILVTDGKPIVISQ